ncbi:MAG: hypothetical protein J6T98_10430 [Salinivirgaceae bacterium]|nr:hypothetical protein [Salinivirgaceae bacterium]
MNTKHVLQAITAFAFGAICSTGYAQNNGTANSDEPIIITKDSSADQPVIDTTIWANPQERAQFPGGDSVLRQYIIDNLVYPESAKDPNLNGHVPVSFVIGKDGQIEPERVRIPTDIGGKYRGIEPALDAEIIRVVKSLPKFGPAYRHLYKYGEIERVPVRSQGNILFRIRNGQINSVEILIL